MRNAASSEGEYLPASMAATVWRVMPMRSASSAWVISPRSKRRRRIWLEIGTLKTSEPPPEHDDLRHRHHQAGDHQIEQSQAHQLVPGGVEQVERDAERKDQHHQHVV